MFHSSEGTGEREKFVCSSGNKNNMLKQPLKLDYAVPYAVISIIQCVLSSAELKNSNYKYYVETN